MPCYNDGAYIEEAVASIRAQSYPIVELVIVDDGSDDSETIQILSSLGAQPYIKLIRTNHLGPAGARNSGIKAASGFYILPVDADDKIEPTYIEKAVNTMESDISIGVVYCHADLFGEQSGPWELPDYQFDKMLLDNIVFVSALFQKEDWMKVGGFRTTMEHGMEDYDFWLSILELDKKIYQLPEVLFHYRIKPVSRTTKFQTDPAVVQQTYRQIFMQHQAFYQKYQKEYAIVLRDALIEQLFLNRAWRKAFAFTEKLKRIPFLNSFIKKQLMKE